MTKQSSRRKSFDRYLYGCRSKFEWGLDEISSEHISTATYNTSICQRSKWHQQSIDQPSEIHLASFEFVSDRIYEDLLTTYFEHISKRYCDRVPMSFRQAADMCRKSIHNHVTLSTRYVWNAVTEHLACVSCIFEVHTSLSETIGNSVETSIESISNLDRASIEHQSV